MGPRPRAGRVARGAGPVGLAVRVRRLPAGNTIQGAAHCASLHSLCFDVELVPEATSLLGQACKHRFARLSLTLDVGDDTDLAEAIPQSRTLRDVRLSGVGQPGFCTTLAFGFRTARPSALELLSLQWSKLSHESEQRPLETLAELDELVVSLAECFGLRTLAVEVWDGLPTVACLEALAQLCEVHRRLDCVVWDWGCPARLRTEKEDATVARLAAAASEKLRELRLAHPLLTELDVLPFVEACARWSARLERLDLQPGSLVPPTESEARRVSEAALRAQRPFVFNDGMDEFGFGVVHPWILYVRANEILSHRAAVLTLRSASLRGEGAPRTAAAGFVEADGDWHAAHRVLSFLVGRLLPARRRERLSRHSVRAGDHLHVMGIGLPKRVIGGRQKHEGEVLSSSHFFEVS